MRENKKFSESGLGGEEKIEIKNSGGDFLFRIFFDKKFFDRKNFFGDENCVEEKNKISRRRGERGPDRQKRKPQPWAIGEKKHLRILQLLREGRGQRWVAKELGVGVQTVQRRAEVLRREDDEEGDVDFRRVQGRVCPAHGAVTVWPCVQCLAEEAREMSRDKAMEEKRSWN